MTDPKDRPQDGAAAAATPPPRSRADEPTIATPPPGTAPTTSLGGAPGTRDGRPRRAAFAAGDVVAGRYRIVRFIAQGGMGEVYEAEDGALGDRVALKTIRPDTAEDARAVERFKREINVARRVTHPNACRIFDLGFHRAPGEPEDLLFLTMELLAGETLSERIARAGRLPPAEALPIVEQMAAALEAAHAAGVVHRDFKSSNVVLVPDARLGVRAVVTDFGLARGLSVEGGGLSSISETGSVVGTPAYMAPEQVEGRPLTPAADVYSLGIVLYEMLTGSRPFEGGSALSVAVRRLTEPPAPPRARVPDLDPRWEAVILRCLERDPSRRPPAREVVEALHNRLPAATPAAATAPPRRLSRRTVAAAAAAAVALAVMVALLRRPGPPAASPAAEAAPPPARRALAVLGLKNATGRPQAQWLSTAVAEMLTTDLSVDGKLRAVPGPEVARVKAELGLGEVDTLDRGAAERLRRALGADLAVVGTYAVVGKDDMGLLRIDLRVHDTGSGALLATATASGTEEQLFDVVSRAGEGLRGPLGLGRVPAARALEVQATLPAGREAARLYAEGLARLRVGDAPAARAILEKAVAADPRHPLPRAALAEAWTMLGYSARARDEAQKALSAASSLPRDEQLALEARYHEAVKDWSKAIEARQSLFQLFPDDPEHGLRLAHAQVQGDRPREALATLETLQSQPSAGRDPRLDLARAAALQRMGDFKREQEAAEQAARKATANGARLLLAQARLLQAYALQSAGELDRAAAAVDEARGLFEAAGDRRGLALALERMANVIYARGDLEGARRLYERSLALNREVGDERRVAAVLLNMGTTLLHQGRLVEAEKLYQQCLATFFAIGARYEAAATMTNIGAALQNGGQLGAAERRYRDALKLFGELGERSATAVVLTNLGEILFSRGDLDDARRMHEEALAINRESGDKGGAAYDLYRLGEVFAARGDLRTARERYQEALKMQGEAGDSLAAADTRLGLAALALAQGTPAEAEAAAREAEETLRTSEAADRAALAQVVLAEALLAQGRREEAQRLAERVAGAAAQTLDRRVKLAVGILRGRLQSASAAVADRTAAVGAMERTVQEARQSGLLVYALEARLALGQAELAAGRTAAGRARLQALGREAGEKGFGQIAARATAALGG